MYGYMASMKCSTNICIYEVGGRGDGGVHDVICCPNLPIRRGKDEKRTCDLCNNLLKGQCHEMVVEVMPWSGRLGLN
jgi:hypothetical protein